MKDNIRKQFEESIALKQMILDNQELILAIERAAAEIIAAYRSGRKVILFGNGGSAADAQHIAAELVGRICLNRKALPAIALAANTSTITAVANDNGYCHVFERQIEALAEKGDIVLGISTSGNSENVTLALKKSKEKNALTIGLLGIDGGICKEYSDIAIVIPSKNVQRIQETHITIGHIIASIVEETLFGT